MSISHCVILVVNSIKKDLPLKYRYGRANIPTQYNKLLVNCVTQTFFTVLLNFFFWDSMYSLGKRFGMDLAP